jgi:hypothetical protein
MSEGAFLMGY